MQNIVTLTDQKQRFWNSNDLTMRRNDQHLTMDKGKIMSWCIIELQPQSSLRPPPSTLSERLNISTPFSLDGFHSSNVIIAFENAMAEGRILSKAGFYWTISRKVPFRRVVWIGEVNADLLCNGGLWRIARNDGCHSSGNTIPVGTARCV